MAEKQSIEPGYLLATGFMESCKKFPLQNALFINNRFYTYNDLLEKVEVVFAQLNKKELPACIGIYTSESVWTYASILAISLSGACYVPLNPKLPDQKLSNIVEAIPLRLILSENKISYLIEAEVLILDTKSVAREKVKTIVPQDLAYLLFTSGTTGEPKGVTISKNNCHSFFDHFKKNFDFNHTDKFLQPYELSFDVSVFSIFAALNCGACIYVVPEEGFKYLNCMSMIETHEITVSSMVPTVLQYLEKHLLEFSFPSIRVSFFSGDKLYQHLAKKWKNAAINSRIYNCYGPTETTIVCTSYFWEEARAENESVNNIVPLGKPFEGMECIIVDEENLVVSDQIGELCFTGTQVVASYLHQNDESSFFVYKGKRYYKTGDLAKINKNGNLIFHGRRDSQVKINGFRVELTEIENAIFEFVKKNVIVISETENNMEVLFAFIENEKMNEVKIREGLASILPQYMIPAHYQFLDSFPKNINGKIDRHLLKQYLNE